jgi:hypothetical protein
VKLLIADTKNVPQKISSRVVYVGVGWQILVVSAVLGSHERLWAREPGKGVRNVQAEEPNYQDKRLTSDRNDKMQFTMETSDVKDVV